MGEAVEQKQPPATCRVVRFPDGVFIEGWDFGGKHKFLVRRNTITQLAVNTHDTCVIVCEAEARGIEGERPTADRIATCHPYDEVFRAMQSFEPRPARPDGG